jgi:hypothetical protein
MKQTQNTIKAAFSYADETVQSSLNCYLRSWYAFTDNNLTVDNFSKFLKDKAEKIKSYGGKPNHKAAVEFLKVANNL